MIARHSALAVGSRRWLIVVRQDEQALYGYLRQGFSGVGLVEVILDRRGSEPGSSESAPERRRPATPKERDRWTALGYRLVLQTGGGHSEGSAA